LLLHLLDELLRVLVPGVEFNGLPVVEDRFIILPALMSASPRLSYALADFGNCLTLNVNTAIAISVFPSFR